MMTSTINFNEYIRNSDDRDTAFFELANAKTVRFTLGAKRHIDIVQNPSLHDCCGGVIWETAFCLSQYLLKNLQHKFESRSMDSLNILELGAGCGLLGIVLASMGCSVVLTDVNQALPLIIENSALNQSMLNSKPKVMPLDWENRTQIRAVEEQGQFDVIVATDVVFNTHLVPPLINCLKMLSNPSSFIWICLQERSTDALQLFREGLLEFFHVEKLSVDEIEFADEECILLELQPLDGTKRKKENKGKDMIVSSMRKTKQKSNADEKQENEKLIKVKSKRKRKDTK